MKAVFITIFPSPYQTRFCTVLNKYCDVTYIYCNDTCDGKNSIRPAYWNCDIDDNGVVLNPKKKKYIFGKRLLNQDIKETLDKIDPDVVMLGGFTIPTNYEAYRWARRNKKKCLVYSEMFKSAKTLKLFEKLYPKIDGLLLCGNRTIEQFSSVFPRVPVWKCTYAADLDAKTAIRREVKSGEVTFLFASRFIPQHEPIMCIKAFARLLETGKKAKMIMSSAGSLLDECIVLVKELGIEDSVEFRLDLSCWNDINQLYEDSDVLLFPGNFSSWGLVIPEAMAAGMPVITTREVQASELVDEDQIIVVDEDQLLEAMLKYVNDPETVYMIGQTNRVRAQSECYDEKAKRMCEILNEAAKGKSK